MVFSVCGDSGGIAGSDVDGLGEVQYCDVGLESEIEVRVEDDLVTDPAILVTCRSWYEPMEPIVPVWPFTYYTGYQVLGVGEPVFRGILSGEEGCMSGDQGTILRVFVLKGVAGTIELEYV